MKIDFSSTLLKQATYDKAKKNCSWSSFNQLQKNITFREFCWTWNNSQMQLKKRTWTTVKFKKKTKNVPTFLFTINWLDNIYTRYLWRARRWTFTPSPSKIDLFPTNSTPLMQILKGLQYSGTLLTPTPPAMELCLL